MSTFADYTDEANIVRLRAKGGGGGSQPAKQLAYSDPTSVADGATAFLPLTHVSGDALLDFTDPTKPTIITAGFYMATMNVADVTGPKASGVFQAALTMDDGGTSGAPGLNDFIPLTDTVPQANFAGTWELPAGTIMDLYVANNEGLGDAIDFVGQLWLVRVA